MEKDKRNNDDGQKERHQNEREISNKIIHCLYKRKRGTIMMI